MQLPVSLTIILALATVGTAQADETITIRNKTVKNPQKLYVAQYKKCPSGDGTRLSGIYQIEVNETKTHDKLDAGGCELTLRFGINENAVPASMTNAEFNDLSKYVNRQLISRTSGIQTANITDYYTSDERYESYTDTRQALMDDWRGTWQSVWDAVTTAGDTLNITNMTGYDFYVAEYEYLIGGKAKQLQGPILIPADGKAYPMTKGKLDPGYNDRFISFLKVKSNFPDTMNNSDFMPIGGQLQRSGKGFNNVFLYVKADGSYMVYTQTGLSFRKLGCELLNDAVNLIANAAGALELPDAVTKAIGLDALLKPVEDGISAATTAVANKADIPTLLSTQLDTAFGKGYDYDAINAVLTKLNRSEAALDPLFTSSNFCDASSKLLVKTVLENVGLNVANWAQLKAPDSTGTPFLAVSKTTSIKYKSFVATYTQSHVLDFDATLKNFGPTYSKVISLGLGASTDASKVVTVSKTKSVELYPHVLNADLLGLGLSLGVSGKVGPFSGITAVMPTDLSRLYGVSLGMPNKGSGGYSFDLSEGVSFVSQP